MCQPYNSHNARSQGARLFFIWSSLYLGMVMSSIVGDRSATRAFQSPQTTCTACCGMQPSISSMWLHATSSSTPRFYKFCAGGRYTLPNQTFSLPYPWIHTTCVYSFPKIFKIFIPFFTSIAIPPLRPWSLRYSITWYPGISSFTDEGVSHVSWRHNTSSEWDSRSMYSLNRLTPAILMLPTLIP